MTKLSIEVEAAPCPFCGCPAEFKEIPYRGIGSSGMEIPAVTIGCPRCDFWFPQKPGEAWREGRGTFSVTTESKIALLTLWNNRKATS